MADDVRTLKDKAAKLYSKGKLDAALATWQQVTEAAPADLAAAQKVADLHARLGQREAAVAAYDAVALRYGESGLFLKASAVCRLIHALDPTNTHARDRLAEMYAAANPAKPAAQTTPAPSAPAAAAPVAVAEAVDAPDEGEFEEFEIVIEEEPATVSGQPAVPLLSSLTREELQAVLASAMELREFKDGEVLVEEGAPGKSMFFIAEGAAGVWRGWGTDDKREVDQLGTGDLFGELALVSGSPRLATVVAKGDVQILELPREAMLDIFQQFPRVRMLVDAFLRERLLANAFRSIPMLSALSEDERRGLAEGFEARAFSSGQRIILQGLKVGAVHLLLRGTCHAKHESGQRYPDMHEGTLFGEISVLTGGAATASVIAAGSVVTLCVPAADFRERVLANAKAAAIVEEMKAVRLKRTADLDAKTGGGAKRG